MRILLGVEGPVKRTGFGFVDEHDNIKRKRISNHQRQVIDHSIDHNSCIHRELFLCVEYRNQVYWVVDEFAAGIIEAHCILSAYLIGQKREKQVSIADLETLVVIRRVQGKRHVDTGMGVVYV